MNSKTTKKNKVAEAPTPPVVVVETPAQKRSRIEDEMRSKPRVKLDPV